MTKGIQVARPYNNNMWAAQLNRMGVGSNDMLSSPLGKGSKVNGKAKSLTRPTGQLLNPGFSYDEMQQLGLGGWIKDNKQGVLGGLQTAAGIGMMFVPGMQGFGAGMIGGGIGNIGKEIQGDRQESMMEDQQAFSMEQQAAQLEAMQQPQAALGSYQVNNQYAPTFAKGGKIKKIKMPLGGTVESEMVELEQGEPFRTPEGEIGVIKKDNKLAHSNGGAQLPLEVGTQVLGKQKDPDTKMEYKELGAKLAKSKQKYDKILEENKGTYARNAAKAMNNKLDGQFTALFQKQESLKEAKNQQTFAKGGQIRKFGEGNQVEPWMSDPGMGWAPSQGMLASNIYGTQPTIQGPSVSPGISYEGAGVGNGYGTANGAGLNFGGNALNSISNLLGGGQGFDWGNALNTGMQLAPMAYNFIQGSKPAEHLTAQDYYNPEYNRAIQGQQRGLEALSNRRYDIQPELEASRTKQSISDYNTRTQYGGMGAGAVASNVMASRAQRMRDDQQAYSTKQRFDNQYLAEQAQGESRLSAMRGQLGAQRAGMNFNVANINQQADAARRGMLGTGFGQMSNYAQMQQLMGNQQEMEKYRYDAMQNQYQYLAKWFPELAQQFLQ